MTTLFEKQLKLPTKGDTVLLAWGADLHGDKVRNSLQQKHYVR